MIAGRGSYLAELEGLAQFLGVADIVQFAGFVPDPELRALLHRASCAVIPSLYEPFGIVALEALAAEAPRRGRRRRRHGRGPGGHRRRAAGRHRATPGRCSFAVERLLTEPVLAASSQAAGSRLVQERYSWDAIADGDRRDVSRGRRRAETRRSQPPASVAGL